MTDDHIVLYNYNDLYLYTLACSNTAGSADNSWVDYTTHDILAYNHKDLDLYTLAFSNFVPVLANSALEDYIDTDDFLDDEFDHEALRCRLGSFVGHDQHHDDQMIQIHQRRERK